MKVTYNWLKDFVEIDISPQSLADKLTMAGLEVSSLSKEDGDFVFEIEITSNRPDWLSILGIAREIAAVTGERLNFPMGLRAFKGINSGAAGKTGSEKFRINIEDEKDCPLYTARIIKDVNVGPSPDWIKKRIELLGCRSVNNVVDITNYVLFEYGTPLHAFDFDKVNSTGIFVRRARRNEKMITIDGKQNLLDERMLIIAGENLPLAVAGVMGGKETEVTDETKTVILEAAVFDPAVIRRCRQILGIQTDSAYRFERGVNKEMVAIASLRASQLIEKYAKGSCVSFSSAKNFRTRKKIVKLNLKDVSEVLGVHVNGAKTVRILKQLGFKINASSPGIYKVEIPGHRDDVNLPEDLIEEIARIIGYENIPVTMPRILPRIDDSEKDKISRSAISVLLSQGLNEVITYSLVDRNSVTLMSSGAEDKVVEVLNPLSKEQEILRTTLVPGLLRCLAYNLNQRQEYIGIFEIADIYKWADEGVKEEKFLGIALCGELPRFFEQGAVRDKASILHLKGIVELLFERIGIDLSGFKTQDNNIILLSAGGEEIGMMREVPEAVLNKLDIKNKKIFITELSMDRLISHCARKKSFSPLPRYPAISRDISVIIKDDILVENVLKVIKETGGDLLQEVKINDYYRGRQIPSGSRSVTFFCLYRSEDRTLTEAEIVPVHNSICDKLVSDFKAVLR